jgi:hypothetical protein
MVEARKALLIFVVLSSWTGTMTYSQSHEQEGAKQQYFRKGTFAEGQSDGSFVAGWYSSQLHAMGELPLSKGTTNENQATYRFIWLRTFHHPLVARLVLNGAGSGVLYVKMADGAGGYSPGKVIMNSTFILEREEAQNILSLLSKMDFWHAPTELVNGPSGCDGSEWILEGSNRAAYHVIDRWTPQSGPLHELGLYLVFDIAKLDIPKQEIY